MCYRFDLFSHHRPKPLNKFYKRKIIKTRNYYTYTKKFKLWIIYFYIL